MPNPSVIEKTYRGTWKEMLARRDEIPDSSEVEVKVLSTPTEEDEESRARMRKMMERLLASVEEIAEKERRPVDEIGARIAEEMLRQSRFPGIEFRDFG